MRALEEVDPAIPRRNDVGYRSTSQALSHLVLRAVKTPLQLLFGPSTKVGRLPHGPKRARFHGVFARSQFRVSLRAFELIIVINNNSMQ